MALSNNIRKRRNELGITQSKLAEMVGVTRSTITQWETGWSQPRLGALERLADALGCQPTELLADSRISSDGYIDVPLLGSIAAGQPIDIDTVDDFFPIPDTLASRHPHSFLLRVRGDSMNRKIPNGALALVDPDDIDPDGHSAYAVCVNGYAATIKRVSRLANGYELIPDSYDPTQRPIVFDYGIDGTDEVTIIGKVVWATMPFDYEI